tara:strand:- start:492 stop:881 length:390 start_codon:yes stop_codon:yes gene_type:complete
MGSNITAKFDGQCKICGSAWAVGDQICYQKNPKAICSDKECFTQQGGTISVWTGKSTVNNRDIIITRLPEVDVGDSVKQVADTLQQYIVVAHHLTKSLYPEQDVNTHVFGQIRSKIVDQLLYCTDIQKE